MRILITNDDGIEAPGLDVLRSDRPRAERRCLGGRARNRPERRGAFAHAARAAAPAPGLSERAFAVKGTPTDCVDHGRAHILRDRKPDLVLSGVNRGQNLADDVTYSGTVAGAIEGALLGIPSIALSLAADCENAQQSRNGRRRSSSARSCAAS